MTTLTIHGSNLLATSHVLCCAACHGDIAYVVLPGGDLAVECQSARCGATVAIESVSALPLKDMALTWSAPTEVPPPPVVSETWWDALRDRISVTPLDDLGLEFSAALDGWHVGIFARAETARLAATNWALALRLGIVSRIGIEPPPEDLPTDGPEYPLPGVDCAAERGRCRACGGAHDIQRCPQVWSALRAEREDVSPAIRQQLAA